jgi:hypothetical protein
MDALIGFGLENDKPPRCFARCSDESYPDEIFGDFRGRSPEEREGHRLARGHGSSSIQAGE